MQSRKECGVPDVPTKILLDESRMPTQWDNLVPRPPPQDPARRAQDAAPVVHPGPRPAEPAAPAAAPRHPATRRPGRPRAALPDGAHPPGGDGGTVRRHSRRGPRRVPAVATVAAVPGAPAREGPRNAREDLLQVRG